ncbi:MAG: hypothetical protein LC754_12120 [Acidobacteria bacterium]|nr:hypothetical protein [Acidobacteriota bacterium]
MINKLATYFSDCLENIEGWTGKFIQSNESVELQSSLKHFKPDDVLFSKLRPYLAKAVLVKNQGTCVGELLVLRCRNSTLLPEYLINAVVHSAAVMDRDGAFFVLGAASALCDRLQLIWADMGYRGARLKTWVEQGLEWTVRTPFRLSL